MNDGKFIIGSGAEHSRPGLGLSHETQRGIAVRTRVLMTAVTNVAKVGKVGVRTERLDGVSRGNDLAHGMRQNTIVAGENSQIGYQTPGDKPPVDQAADTAPHTEVLGGFAAFDGHRPGSEAIASESFTESAQRQVEEALNGSAGGGKG